MSFRLVLVTMFLSSTIAGATQQPTNVALHAPGVYQKWLQEDVPYIITPAEKAEFEKLATDADRDHFIEQFWLKRDPTPGTQENEFKEEHYRRIAYSNEQFAEKHPGWMSDRGHVYILYGPPDSTEQQPALNVQGKEEIHVAPFIVWHYRKAPIGWKKGFTFVDDCRCNEYKLKRK